MLRCDVVQKNVHRRVQFLYQEERKTYERGVEQMTELKIAVRNKRASGTGTIVCGNNDYMVIWDLDREWDPFNTKTMRVQLPNGTHQDVVFTGDSAVLPVQNIAGWVSIGLFAGDIHTSRGTDFLVEDAITTVDGPPAAPETDVYAQIMSKLNELSAVDTADIVRVVEDYQKEHLTVVSMRAEDGYIQFSADGELWENMVALEDLRGVSGNTPIKGTDYWTAADKQEIVNSVIAALPDGTEVSY